MISSRAISIVLVPTATVTGYATYVRSTSQPPQAHSTIMTLKGSDRSGHEQWRKINNGLGLVDVGRSCGDVAYENKVPLVITCSGILNPEIRLPYINVLGSAAKTTSIDMSLWERFQQKYVDFLRLIWHVYPQITQLDRIRQQYGIHPTSFDVYAKWTNALRLVNGFFGFAPAQPLGPLTHMVGPIINPDRQAKLGELEAAFLATRQRVAYVAFGQNLQPEPHGFRVLIGSLLDQLEKGNLDGVIWARFNHTVPTTVLSSVERRMSVANRCHDVSRLIEAPYHAWFLTLDWAPQFAILQHPSTRVFVSHGGAESAHEALYNGVPLLIHPFVGDQALNGNALQTVGVAMSHDRNKCTLEEVNYQLEYLLKDENGYVASNLTRMQILTKIGSHRKHYAADLIEEHMFTSVDGVPVHRYDVSRSMSWMKSQDLDLHFIVVALSLYILWLIRMVFSKNYTKQGGKMLSS
ncbi:hypothetical protein EC973_009517 [Apophysomyces ossiformis]|uniref:UDP-Glycosyltransferase/glycogen phosphorylase n=1 Tax=Apophysomyces ossiformis TaxID=679940 RepID=A0A8H7BRV8_9FUNG|nr:hypothetical protein EC973_009517 [Apophysomyces ossiformis]